MPKKKNKSGFRFKKDLTQKILNLFSENPATLYNYKQISAKLNIKDLSQRKLINEILYDLEFDEMIEAKGRGQFKGIKSSSSQGIEGKISFTQRGAAYVITDQLEEDVFIHQRNTGHAFNNDIVQVQLKTHGGKLEGEVINVVERAKHEFVGTIDISANAVFVRPDDSKMPVDFFIERGHLKGAKNGEKVIVKFLTWPQRVKSPFGAVVERLGASGSMDVEMHSILAEFGFPFKFPNEVTVESEKIKEADYKVEVKNRRDFRDVLTFTIDPHDAKDFDDALSYKELKNGNIEVGIHIADVSHYVQPNTELDKEAYSRGNSVYLVDRVIPMLPEILSNKLCSLRPEETKLTFSAVFELDKEAKVVNEWFGKTIIYSDKRFAYEDAQAIIEGKVQDEYFGDVILTMDKYAKALRKKRMSTGALEIESQEVRFNLDEQGNPLGVILKVSKDANKLIEEFMLLANRRVATFIGKPEPNKLVIPFLYRTHDEPNEEKIADLKIFLDQFGYKIQHVKDKPISFALNKVMDEAKAKDELHIIGPMVIRSMSKAIYETDNIGHYGLAFDYYSHFTSPIRRYADLLVHRVLFEKLNNRTYHGSKELDAQCKHISATEKEASSAERSSTKYMQVKFMSDKIGQSFEGKITGVTDFGLFVELNETKCEGLIHVSTLQGNFSLNDKTKRLESYQTGESFYLGQAINVVVKNTDIFKKQIDLELAK